MRDERDSLICLGKGYLEAADPGQRKTSHEWVLKASQVLIMEATPLRSPLLSPQGKCS